MSSKLKDVLDAAGEFARNERLCKKCGGTGLVPVYPIGNLQQPVDYRTCNKRCGYSPPTQAQIYQALVRHLHNKLKGK